MGFLSAWRALLLQSWKQPQAKNHLITWWSILLPGYFFYKITTPENVTMLVSLKQSFLELPVWHFKFGNSWFFCNVRTPHPNDWLKGQNSAFSLWALYFLVCAFGQRHWASWIHNQPEWHKAFLQPNDSSRSESPQPFIRLVQMKELEKYLNSGYLPRSLESRRGKKLSNLSKHHFM